MAAVEGLSLGFAEAKLERRRPCKRQTTLRSFSIVRNWESKQVQPGRTPIKEDANEEQVVSSPVFPPPSSGRRSLEVPLTSGNDSTKHSPTEANDIVSFQPDDKHKAPCETIHSPTTSTDSIVADDSTAASVDESISSQMEVPASPESQVHVALQVPAAISPQKPVSGLQDKTAEPIITPASPSKESPPSRVTRGRKRKQDKAVSEEKKQKNDTDEDEDENDGGVAVYSANNFVRIFNADQGRKLTMGEITALDVALTVIEELALEYREKDEYGDAAKQSIKEFFIQIRKTFCECIDIQKTYQTLKSDHRKVNSKIKKLRGELLNVQKKRARIRGELKKYEKEEMEEMESEKNNQDLLDITEYLHQIEHLHQSCKKMAKDSDIQNEGLASNLASLLSQTHARFNSLSTLQSINSSLKQLLCT